MIAYLLQMIACSGILYGYYHFFLRNEKFHQYNRFYLLAIVILSLVLPLFKIQVYFEDNADMIYQSLGSLNEGIVVVSNKATASWLNATTAVYLVYTAITLFFMIRIIAALRRILRIKSEGAITKTDGIIFINTTNQEAPFSFFRWLFWNKNISLNSTEGEHIFRHEMYHIRKKHTYDLMFTELITALFWFNPFFYLIKNEVKAIQEFLADKHATEEQDACGYAELLLMQAIGSYKYKLVNPFFHNQLKRRIAMLTSSKKPGYQWLRKLSVLPLVFLTACIILISCNSSNDEATSTEATKENVSQTPHVQNEPPSSVDSTSLLPAQGSAIENSEKLNTASASKNRDKKIAEQVSSKVEVDAKYPGNWRMFLERNLDGNVAVNAGAPAGTYTAIIQFVVDTKGNVSEVKALTKQGYGMEQEAMRVIKRSGKWMPAIQHGKEVKAYRKQPITFQVREEGNAGVFTPQVIIKDKSSAEREPEIFTKVETDASYPGNWRSFLERNLDGTVGAKNGAPAGTYTTIVQFIVDRDGNVSDVKAISATPGRNGKLVGYGMDEEAVRVIKRSGKWKPAIQNGRVVGAYRKQPITFEITDA